MSALSLGAGSVRPSSTTSCPGGPAALTCCRTCAACAVNTMIRSKSDQADSVPVAAGHSLAAAILTASRAIRAIRGTSDDDDQRGPAVLVPLAQQAYLPNTCEPPVRIRPILGQFRPILGQEHMPGGVQSRRPAR